MIKKRNTTKQYEYTGGDINGKELRTLGLEGWKLVYWYQGTVILTREIQKTKLKL